MKKRISIGEYRKRAEEYFSMCDRENSVCEPKQSLAKPYTLSGLLCALELTRQEFFSLGKSREGKRFINFALMKIEAFIEENALSGRISATFAQGALKYSFGWGEKEIRETEEPVTVTLSQEALKLGE